MHVVLMLIVHTLSEDDDSLLSYLVGVGVIYVTRLLRCRRRL